MQSVTKGNVINPPRGWEGRDGAGRTEKALRRTEVLHPPKYAFWDIGFKLVIKKDS